MALFGKSEAELKKIAVELDKRQIELDNRESTLSSMESNLQHEKTLLDEAKAGFDAERETLREEMKRERDAIEAEKAELEKRRLQIAKLEAEAKNGFIEKQREAFKEVIEKRLAELDVRQQELERAEEQLAARYKELHAKEGEIAKRELEVTEREQKADVGFADKAKALADEANRQYQANQAEAERLRKLADDLAEERQRLEEEKAKLLAREQAIIAAEQKRDADFADERAALDAELRDRRAQVENELTSYREERLAAIEQEIAYLRTRRLKEVAEAENAERDRILAEIAAERERWAKQQESARDKLERERTDLEKRKGAVSALQSELEGRMVELEAAERTLERKEQRLERRWEKRNENLDDKIESRLAEERKSMEAERQSLRDENARLRESLRIQKELVAAFDQLKQQLGDRDPADILRELNSKTDEIRRLREELATHPTEEMRERYKEMQAELERYKARNEELTKQIDNNAALVAEAKELRRRNSELEADNKMFAQKAERLEAAANEAQAELQRLRAAYERPQEVDARYKEIELPLIKVEQIKQASREHEIDEISWLKGIGNACKDYGLHFHPRILKAFHTALKTAEWSPISILAGVSGTGKSELPRLYSHFGGLMFHSLSVQPNWDSQESMLGFFNSIDNKFDAQPVLRFLAQSQKDWSDEYPGLHNAMCLILLDEMNLAHPELYFAEFLSKLELRRGMKGTDVPCLPVKIGAGLPPYQLPLGRNVLWTGTMNQDETTKSLSDKVLDRSIVIYFPRPTTLTRRLELKALDESNRGPILHKKSWFNWLSRGSSFEEKQIKPFKDFIEEMNKALAISGRAIGHRVWQSVEYYMANYPDVRAAQKNGDKDALENALHIAFEDQLVQKIMPKLRGIDTRGKSKTDCLDKIRDQITTGIGGNPFHIEEDFDLACELGYGQFIWQSANYLSEQDGGDVLDESHHADAAEDKEAQAPDVPTDLSTPSDNYRPDDADREEKWKKLSKKQRRMFYDSHEKGKDE